MKSHFYVVSNVRVIIMCSNIGVQGYVFSLLPQSVIKLGRGN